MSTSRRGFFGLLAGASALPFLPKAISAAPAFEPTIATTYSHTAYGMGYFVDSATVRKAQQDLLQAAAESYRRDVEQRMGIALFKDYEPQQ